jgi:hypothetical protein
MKWSHRRQFAGLVKLLLLGNPEQECDPIDKAIIFQIMAELEDEVNIDFRQFSRRVEEISGLKVEEHQ